MTRFYVFLLLLVRRQSPGHFVRSSAARCLVIFLLSANVGLAQTIRYVRAGGTGDGLSWPTASGNLQAMINATGVQQVWVASGTYKPTTGTDRSISFSMKNGVSILGGFAASGSPALADRNPATHPTTLSGEINNDNDLAGNSYHVINNSGLDNTARLGGFIITGGNARGGTNAFIDNVGGAISNTNSNPSLTSCSFQNNAAVSGGAVSNNTNSNPSLINCSFQNNTASDDGGAIYNGSSSNPSLTNCSFQNNTASDDGGAIYNVTSSNPSLTNCSFFNNTAQDGGAIFNFINGNSTLTNCVLFGNGGNKTIGFLSASGASASYCLFDDTVTNYTGSNNRTTATNPFISATDLRLNVCAPAINTGDNAAYSTANGPATDLAGQTRVVNTTIDMGAFEFQTTPNTPLTITTQPVAASTICAGATVSVAVSVNGTLASNPYQWFRNGASVPGQTSNTLSLPNLQTSDQGSYVLGITGACNSLTSNAFTLTVNPNPSLSLQATPSLTITSGQTSLLTASGATSYRWSTGETTPAITVSEAGPYSVTGTTGGCSSVTSVVVSVTVPCGAVVYVTEAGAGLQNGSSWTNAFSGTALQTAINTAAGCGAQVWVARGLYKPTTTMDRTISFSMKKGVAIYGGFSGNGTETMVSQRNWITNPTILSGDIDGTPDAITGSGSTLSITGNGGNSYHVIYNHINGLRDDARLDGFTITGGNANGSNFPNNSGGGMYGSMVSPTVINCVFTGNTAATNGGGMYHAGYYNRSNNETPSGVVYMKVTNCTFSTNKATSGGGLYMYVGVNMTLDNVVFSKNAATGSNGIGGGLFLSDSRPTLSNVVFSENAAERWGGAISTFGTNAYIANGTFSNNTVAGTATEDAGGISFSNDIVTSLYLLNCVFWNNRIGNNTIKSLGRDVNRIYAVNCDFQDLSSLTALNKTNCIDQDPQFVDAGDPDGLDNQWMTADDGLSVRSTSPVVNSGVGSTQTVGNSTNTLNAPSTDIVGNPRPYMNTAVDMGAYEFQGSPSLTLLSSASPNPVCAGATTALSVTASGGTSGMPDQPYSYTWVAPAGITLSATSTSAVSASIGTGLSGPQTFTITVASSGGSPTSTSLVSLVVNATPTVNITANPSLTITQGQSTILTAAGATTYQWSTTETINPITVSPRTTVPYSVRGTTNGCSSVTTVTVTVNAPGCGAGLSGPTWTGCVSTDWNTAGNWASGTVPTATDDVVIPSAPANQPVLSTTAVAKSVEVQSGASLSITAAGSLTINSFATLGGFPTAFYNQGTVNNKGTLMLGNTAPAGLIGLHNTGTFTNTGTLQIDRATNQGINNRDRATFTNTGLIAIGTVVSMGTQGIWNQASFANTGGTILIDRINGDGLLNSGNFVNSAAITIGASASVTGSGIANSGTFSNSACAILTVGAPINNSSNFTNAGLFTVSTTRLHSNTGTLTNNGLISYPQGNPISNVVNNDVVVAPVSSCNTAFSPALQLGGNNAQFTVGTTWYTDQALTQAGGIYDPTTNTFTATGLAPGSSRTLYFTATDNANSCTRILSISVTASTIASLSIAANPSLTITQGQSATLTASGANSYSWTSGETTAAISVSVAGPYSVTGIIGSCSSVTTITLTVNAPVCGAGLSGPTWTGCVSTDWNTAGNWASGTVPTATDDVVIPSAPASQPVISTTAVAKSVEVQGGASLSISSAGSLTLNGSKIVSVQIGTTAFVNRGTVSNGGQLVIGNTASVGNFGLYNLATFENGVGGRIQIDNSTLYGLLNGYGGRFTNSATITVGATARVGTTGLYNLDTFENQAGGYIQLDNSTGVGIYNSGDGRFTNSAMLIIGATAAVGLYGIYNRATFENQAGGYSQLDNSTYTSLYNDNNGTFINSATITIGSLGTIGGTGIRNEGPFANSACATLTVLAPIINYNNSPANINSFSNAGLITVNTAQAHTNTRTLTNNGIISYPQGNPIPNVVNNDVIASAISSCSNTISPALQLGGNSSQFTVGTTWYSDQALTQPAGTYNQATNTFTATNLAPGSSTLLYFSVADGTNGCTKTVSVSVTVNQSVTASIIPSAMTVCAGTPVSLTASGAVGAGTSWQWNTGAITQVITVATNGPSGATGIPGSPTGPAGPYSVTVTTAAGCSASATITLTVNPIPVASISPSSLTVCQGQPASLTASGGTDYLWSTGETTAVINVMATGTYSVTVSGRAETGPTGATGVSGGRLAAVSGCSSTTSVMVTVNALPAAGLVSNGTLTCAQTSVTLTASGGITGETFSYTFTNGSGTVLGIPGAGNTLVVSNPGMYSVRVANASGCTSIASVSVSQDNTATTVSISPASMTITQGQTATLTASATGASPFAYVWSTSQTTPTISVSTAATYSLTVTATNGCSATASATVSVTMAPVVTASFAITGVTTVDCTPVLPDRYSISFTPRYAGLTGQPITFSITNELLPTTAAGPYSLQLYTDNPILLLKATQAGTPSQSVSFSYNWLDACRASVSANTPPRVMMSLPPQSATVGVGFSYVIPAGTFTDDQTPGSLLLTASGLPAGLSLSGYTISGTPSNTAGSPFSVSITATDPGSLSVSTSFVLTVSPAPLTPPAPTGAFSITGVSLLRCTPVADRINISFAPQYAGLNGQAIAFRVVNELAPTNDPAPYSLTLYRDNPVIRLRATQTGSVGEASFDYNWLVACASIGADNTAPRVVNPVGSQTATVGAGYSVNLSNVFADQETPNGIVLSASGLPAGLTLTGTAISGTPSVTGVSTVVLTASDPGNLSVSTSFMLTVSPAASVTAPSGVFNITGVQTVSCVVVSAGLRRVTFTPQYSGLTGQPISFRVVNELAPTSMPGPYSLNLYTDNPVISLRATQTGTPGEVSFAYNWLGVCNAGSRIGAEPVDGLIVTVLGNPVIAESVTVEVRGAAGERLQLDVLDSQGKFVRSTVLEQATVVDRVDLRLGSLAGVYLLRVSSPTHRQTLKLVKP